MKATVTDVTKRITITDNKSAGIVNYDIDNAYPQRVEDINNSSGTGSLCTKILGKFIYGQGFINEALSKTIVNSKRLTANKLLFKSGKAVSKFNGFCIHVNYDANFEKRSFSVIPFKDARFTNSENEKHPNMIAVYDDWERVKKSRIIEEEVNYFNYYNPDPKQIQQEVDAVEGWHNYKGQVMYWSVDGVEYPLAPSDSVLEDVHSVLEDVQTDSHAKTFKFRNITTNFMASHILRVGKFEDEEQREDFTGTLTDFQGDDEASKILVIEQEGEDDLFDLEKVDIQDISNLYEYTETSARNNIIRTHLIPPVLLIATAGKLGSSTEITDATAFYNGVTSDYRLEISAAFKELFTNSVFESFEDFDIKEVEAETSKAKDTETGKKDIVSLLSNPTLSESQKQTTLEVVYNMSKEDSMKLIPTRVEDIEGGVEAVDEEAKARAALKGSVGGVTGLLSIQAAVNAGTTTPDSGAAVLELIYGMSPDEARRMLGTSINTDTNV